MIAIALATALADLFTQLIHHPPKNMIYPPKIKTQFVARPIACMLLTLLGDPYETKPLIALSPSLANLRGRSTIHVKIFHKSVCFLPTTFSQIVHSLVPICCSIFQNFQTHNTDEQNSHILQNFDLKEYRQALNDIAVHIYQELLKTIQDELNPFIGMSLLFLSMNHSVPFVKACLRFSCIGI